MKRAPLGALFIVYVVGIAVVIKRLLDEPLEILGALVRVVRYFLGASLHGHLLAR
jgi:hypothetical protein